MSDKKMADQESIKTKQAGSYISGGSAAYLEELYEQYLADPSAVPQEWQQCFKDLPSNNGAGSDESHAQIRQQFYQLAQQGRRVPHVVEASDVKLVRKQGHVSQLINAYRSHGHHHAKLDPLGSERQQIPDLTLGYHNLSHDDLNSEFSCDSFLAPGKKKASLKEIFESLNDTYCGSIGIEYMHITDNEQVQWIQQRVEANGCKPQFNAEDKKHILEQLTAAEGLERYLGSKYVGQKRFSLEGGESLIPMLDELVVRAGKQGVKEFVIGMAHRGRLNVLVNILGKAPNTLFDEFEGKFFDEQRTGDVKYHMGFSSDIRTPGGEMHLTLGFNPSHLEIISPVIMGSVRARQDRRGDTDHQQVVPVIIHGDAAFAGQGVVMETFNMSQARGYRIGGIVHVVINNQIGFTTSNPLDSRSTLYCTDVAKMVQAPILHVNGDDPEAVVFATQLAFDFRMRFKKDVVLDLVCYRKHGHNESDEPSITQPLMYKNIRSHDSTVSLYANQLQQQGVLTEQQATAMVDDYRAELDAGHSVVDLVSEVEMQEFTVDWTPYLDVDWDAAAKTAISKKSLANLANKITDVPDSFTPQAQVKRELDNRRKMAAGELPLNWGFAETMAYASLLDEGYPVRLTGQDCCRGTFSHRQAVLHDYKDGSTHTALEHISDEQGMLTIIDSVLSEEAVMAFEYGYATAEPNSLVLWEGQFGDFANGAQVVIDQFISSGEQKWGRMCGLGLLLPHGYEGMGPEHSSARLERFLQMCAQHNMQVCIPSTPAQCFHMLRRQVVRPMRRPLIVMTPKSLLRHKLAVSSLEDLTNGHFHNVIDEIDDLDESKVKRLVLCSGKVYYDLLQQRRTTERQDVAIIRIEQLYPFPANELKDILKPYSKVKDIIWCQEEPMNQGAWYSSQHHIRACLTAQQKLHFAGREPAAAPAVGYTALHKKQQMQLVEDALG